MASAADGDVEERPSGRAYADANLPRQLPGDPMWFVNRSEGLALLDAMHDRVVGRSAARGRSGSPVAVITGPPGVGKTALALRWAHQMRRWFVDGDLYIDMRAYGTRSPVSSDQALDAFLRALHVPPERIPIETAEKSSMFRSLLSDKRILIVVDNVSSVRQLRDLLPGTHECVVLATSRGQLTGLIAREGATRVPVEILSADDSVALLAEIIGDERVDSRRSVALKIAELCGHLPLALRVVAERILSHPHLSLSDVLDQLGNEKRRLDTLAAEDDELSDTRAAFSWSYHMLSTDHRRVFRYIGLHPGAEFGSSLAAALTESTEAEILPRLQELVDVHLLQQTSSDRFKLHDLLRVYSLELGQREDQQRERTLAVRRILVWYLLLGDVGRRQILPFSHALDLTYPGNFDLPSLRGAAEAVAWFLRERISLLAALQIALDWGQYDIAWKLPVVLDGFFELQSYWSEWRQIHEDGLQAAVAVGDNLGRASNLLCLGDAHWRLKDQERAFEAYSEAERFARLAGDQWVAAFAIRGTGLIYQDRTQWEAAMERYEVALPVFRGAGSARGEAMTLLSIGQCRWRLGDRVSGAETCEQALRIFRRIGDRWSEAWGVLSHAKMLLEAGEVERARAALEPAARVFEEFKDRRSTAQAQEQIGRTFAHQGDRDRAAAAWRRAVDLLDELADSHADELRSELDALMRSGDG